MKHKWQFFKIIYLTSNIWWAKSNLMVGYLWPKGLTLGSPGLNFNKKTKMDDLRLKCWHEIASTINIYIKYSH